MNIIVTTPEEIQKIVTQSVNQALNQTFSEQLPKLIRQACRKEWLTTDEVMGFLQCSRRHVQHLRDSGYITFHQTKRTIRYHIDDLEEYMRKGKVRCW